MLRVGAGSLQDRKYCCYYYFFGVFVLFSDFVAHGVSSSGLGYH